MGCEGGATDHIRMQHSTHPAQRMRSQPMRRLSGWADREMVAQRGMAVTSVRLLQTHGAAVCSGSGAITISSAACSSLVRPTHPQPNPSHIASQRQMAQYRIAQSSHVSYGVLRSVYRSALAGSATRIPKAPPPAQVTA